jgi:thiol:disulfide interchange protein DsbD
VVFIFLSLGMFGVLVIDLSRLQTHLGSPSSSKRGTFVGAMVLGGVAALLAGACVAPVVISVLLLAADLTEAGHAAGQTLPFILGIGMGLPWPFVGAGFSFLPKPGKWMDHVKHGFGVVILGFAIWYLYQAYGLMMDASTSSMAKVAQVQEERIHEGWFTSLDEGIEAARRENKPIFIDFWASWCKNCLKMEKTTFKSGEATFRLDDYVKVKYQAQNMKDPAIRPDLDRFGIIGLPTYVVLSVGEEEE